MKITLCTKTYLLEKQKKSITVLSSLFTIKKKQNRSLAFRSGCKSGVCGSCAIIVNGTEKLACKTMIKDEDVIEPLSNSVIIKDLIVELENQERFLKQSQSFLEQHSSKSISKDDVHKIDIESNCVLCSSCLSSCPIYSVNENFIGPFALA